MSIRTVDLSSNPLRGTLPSEIGRLREINSLYISQLLFPNDPLLIVDV